MENVFVYVQKILQAIIVRTGKASTSLLGNKHPRRQDYWYGGNLRLRQVFRSTVGVCTLNGFALENAKLYNKQFITRKVV